jgi:hypothetical protein
MPVGTAPHALADVCKRFEVALLTGQQRKSTEMGNDTCEQRSQAPTLPLDRLVASVRPKASAFEVPLHQQQYLRTVTVLAY